MGRARVGVVVTGVRRVRARAVTVLAVVLVAEAVRVVLAVDGVRAVAVMVAVGDAMRGPWALDSASSPS